MSIKSVHLKLHITQFTQKSTYEDIGPFVSGIADDVLESNWKFLLESINPDLEIHIGDMVKSIFTPIFDNIALGEFYDGQPFLEAYPIVSDSENPNSSSSSSSVVQISISSTVFWSVLLFSISFNRK